MAWRGGGGACAEQSTCSGLEGGDRRPGAREIHDGRGGRRGGGLEQASSRIDWA